MRWPLNRRGTPSKPAVHFARLRAFSIFQCYGRLIVGYDSATKAFWSYSTFRAGCNPTVINRPYGHHTETNIRTSMTQKPKPGEVFCNQPTTEEHPLELYDAFSPCLFYPMLWCCSPNYICVKMLWSLFWVTGTIQRIALHALQSRNWHVIFNSYFSKTVLCQEAMKCFHW